MMRKRNGFLAALLCAALVMSMLSTPVYADTVTLIGTKAELMGISGSGSYRLISDIDLAGVAWSPLSAFTGTLDGNGHVIRNLSITNTTATGNNNALFASIGSGGSIRNLGIENASITAGDNVGILAATNAGAIRRCYTTGTVGGDETVGGLVGTNTGIIENCYSHAAVNGTDNLGGLAGINSGTVTTSYAASPVTGSVLNNYLSFNTTEGSTVSGGYIDIDDNAAYRGNAFTLEAWFQWDDANTNITSFIIGKGYEQFEIHTGGRSGHNGLRFIPVPHGANENYNYLGGTWGDSWIDAKNVLQAGWFHVAAVYWYQDSHAYAKIYVNGEAQPLYQSESSVSVGTIATLSRNSNPLAENSAHINIGRRTDASLYFSGKIADVRFWNTARTEVEIKANKDRVLTGNEPGLVGYWRLDDSLTAPLENRNVDDITGNDNQGTIHGDVTQTTAAGIAAHRGALVGANTGIVFGCFYDTNVSGSTVGGAGESKTTGQMQQQDTFTNWDFDEVWKMAPASYPSLQPIKTLTLSANGGTADGTATATRGSAALAGFTGVSRVGYSPIGYYTAQTGGNLLVRADGSLASGVTGYTDADGKWTGESGVTLYAHWLPNSYTVAYDGNKPAAAAGTVANIPSDHTCTYDSSFSLGAAPALAGYIFDGWYKDTAYTELAGAAGQSQINLTAESGATVTLYARWKGEPVDPPASDNAITGVTAGQRFLLGDTVTFTAMGAGMNNTSPAEGDMRWLPTAWETNPSGTWSDAPYSASFSVADMNPGDHTLTVTFTKQRYGNGAWADIPSANTEQTSVTFTLLDGPADVPDTGDSSAPALWMGALLLTAAGLAASARLSRRTRNRGRR